MTHFTSKTLFKILFPAFLFQMHVLDLIREKNPQWMNLVSTPLQITSI